MREYVLVRKHGVMGCNMLCNEVKVQVTFTNDNFGRQTVENSG